MAVDNTMAVIHGCNSSLHLRGLEPNSPWSNNSCPVASQFIQLCVVVRNEEMKDSKNSNNEQVSLNVCLFSRK